MKFTIARKDLHEAVVSTGRCVASNTSLPCLKNMLITPNGTEASFSATNLEVGVERKAAAEVSEGEGAVSVPARALAEIVAALPEGEVRICSEDHRWMTLASGRSEYKLATLAPEDHPSLPELNEGTVLTLPGKLLAASLKKVLVAASRDETRPILTGVFVTRTPEGIALVATDTHRLHVCPVALPGGEGEGAWIVPFVAATEIAREVGGAEDVTLRFDANQVEAVAPRWRFVSRLIEGQFPRYERVLPNRAAATTTLTVPRSDLIALLKRALLIAKEAAAAGRVILTAGDAGGLLAGASQTLTVTAEAGEMGTAREELEIAIEGQPLTFAVNARLLIDTLEAVEGEGATLRLTDPLAPLLISGEGEFAAVVMPMNVS